MRRRFSSLLLLTTLPIWGQFQPAPPPDANSQAGGPAYSQQPPQYEAQYPYPGQSPQPYPSQQQQQPYPAQGEQQESRDWATDQQHGVARIRIVQGDVNVKRADGTLTGAAMNAPMFTNDHLETGPGSRAEVELDSSMFLRLAPDTDLGFANLAFGRAQAQLGLGTVILRIAGNSPTQIELDTPSVALRPLTQGEFRISVLDNGTSQISVHVGRLDMSGPRGSQNVEQGQTVMVRGDANDPEFQTAGDMPRDQFDDWSASRDAELLSAQPPPNVPSNVYGAEDLNQYGSWVPSQYGQVWAPQEGPDWSPYSNGEWAYTPYYGWTWVGAEPWGWAPYHYGRWFFNTGVGWCWWPGALRAGLAFGFGWSPALVSFFTFGGGLGWVTLAPFELFHPWWGHGFGGYGVFRGYDVGRFYRNAGIRGGAMTAGLNGFGGPGRRYAFATGGQLRGASLYRGSVPVTPTASSYRFSDRAVSANPRLSQAASRTFFSSRSASSGFNRGSFNSRPNVSAGGGSSGWAHFGSPAPQSRPSTQGFYNRPGGNTGESGWHSFGQPQAPRSSAPQGNQAYRAPSTPNYGGYRAPSTSNYGYRAPSTAAPRYSAPRYNPPSQQHYSAPRGNSGGGGHSSGGHSGGGGAKHSGGGGGHHR